MSIRGAQNYAFGNDLSSPSLKLVILDFSSKLIVETVSVPLSLTQNDQGLAEQSVPDWVQAIEQVFEKVPPEIRSEVVTISLSCQQHGVVVIKGNDVFALFKLCCDKTSSSLCVEPIHELGVEDACLKSVGNFIFPGFTAPKLKYLKANCLDIHRRIESMLLLYDYLKFWLTGEICMEMGDASGTGLLDVKKRAWSESMINAERGLV